MKILGIDEAGRGPIAGSMYMCGYMISEENVCKLKELGVKDSKMLTPEKRKKLAPKIKRIADDYMLLRVSPEKIDNLHGKKNLNMIEIENMQHMINFLHPDKVIVDSPEVNTKKFSQKIMQGVKHNGFELISENFADKRHLEVGAASIIAKVHRDAEIEKLHKKHGFFGSGYTSDERTIAFLKNWIKVNKEFPGFVRKSWITASLIKEEVEQKRLSNFTGKV